MKTLYSYQQPAVDYCLRESDPALFMEMRLGKTIVTIEACCRQGLHKNLVVAPSSVIPTWQRELTEAELDVFIPLGTKRQRAKWMQHIRERHHGWYLINYEILIWEPAFANLKWDAVILDESTRIKNPKAKVTKLCLRSFQSVSVKFILSGLPAPEGPADYFTQLAFLDGEFMGCPNYWAFLKRFFHKAFYDWVPNPKTLTRVKETVHARAFVLTRRQAGIENKIVREQRVVEMTKEQKLLYHRLQREFVLGNRSTKWTFAKIIWAAQLAGGFSGDRIVSKKKMKELLILLQGELSQELVVVSFRFNHELYACGQMLFNEDIPFAPISGEIDRGHRDHAIQHFQNGDVRVLLCQIKCVHLGLDLSSSDTLIHYSRSYSMEENTQIEDRIVHPEKSVPLLYVDLVTEKSIDEDVLEVVQDKRVSSKFFMAQLIKRFGRRSDAWRCKNRS